jgi:hypothetical protein
VLEHGGEFDSNAFAAHFHSKLLLDVAVLERFEDGSVDCEFEASSEPERP